MAHTKSFLPTQPDQYIRWSSQTHYRRSPPSTRPCSNLLHQTTAPFSLTLPQIPKQSLLPPVILNISSTALLTNIAKAVVSSTWLLGRTRVQRKTVGYHVTNLSSLKHLMSGFRTAHKVDRRNFSPLFLKFLGQHNAYVIFSGSKL
jgi:hypothetical protein